MPSSHRGRRPRQAVAERRSFAGAGRGRCGRWIDLPAVGQAVVVGRWQAVAGRCRHHAGRCQYILAKVIGRPSLAGRRSAGSRAVAVFFSGVWCALPASRSNGGYRGRPPCSCCRAGCRRRCCRWRRTMCGPVPLAYSWALVRPSLSGSPAAPSLPKRLLSRLWSTCAVGIRLSLHRRCAGRCRWGYIFLVGQAVVIGVASSRHYRRWACMGSRL